MKIGAIVVSQNTRWFPAALRRIEREADKTIGIENLRKAKTARAATIVNARPLSFAQNINKGWRRLKGCDAILIANSDIEVPKNWRYPLEAALEDEPEMGAVSLPLNMPRRYPGVSKVCPLVFTLVRVAAVTWADVPMDEDFVNYATDCSLSWALHEAGWLHSYVEGPMVIHYMSEGDKRSFKSGEECPRTGSKLFEEKTGVPISEFNTENPSLV